MNIISFIPIIALFFMTGCCSSSTAPDASSINALSSEYQSQIGQMVDMLVGLDNSSHVVLSIDSSGSMNDPKKTAKKAALSLLSQLENKTKGNIDIGYVVWSNTTLSRSYALSSDIKIIYNSINSTSKFGGFTCMRRGLNESINLLRRYNVPGTNNILILISDGKDNCAPDSLSCDNIGVLNTKGLYIYAIQFGNSTNGTKLLECLENNSPIYEPSTREGKSQEYYEIEKYEIKNSPTNMLFQTNVDNSYFSDPYTKMAALKEITWNEHGPRIALTIKAPSVKDVKANIAIALDSSGSLGVGGRTEYGDNIRKTIPSALKKINETMPKSKVSIISWDDNIDFAGWPLNNTNASNATLIPISAAISDIDNNQVFMSNAENWTWPLSYLAGLRWLSFRDSYYHCDETESTNLSIGLESARKVLNNTANNEYGVRKLIILLTARSEFTPCNQTIINLAKGQNCNIYTIGIGVVGDSLLEHELKKNISSDETKYHYSVGSSVFYNKNVLATVIENAMDQFAGEDISNNIIIKETFYPYIEVHNETVEATINGNHLNASMVPVRVDSDNVTSWEILFDKNLKIKPDDVIKVNIDASLNISLPIDATRSRTSINYSVGKNIPKSLVSYRWIGDNRTYEMPLNECRMNIR